MKIPNSTLKFIALLILIIVVSCQNDDNGGDDDNPNPNPNLNVDNQQPLGSSANEFLSDNEFTRMRVELAYPEGLRPTQQTINLMVPFLQERLNKPGGITLVESVITPEETPPYDINEIVDIEDANRTVFNNGDELGVYIFFSDGNSANDQGNNVILGTAYRNTSMVLYEQTFLDIGNNSSVGVNRTLLETSTLRHEFGHLFGLVNSGTPLQSDHEDPNDSRHCIVEGCLMQASTMTNIFNTSNIEDIPDFDPLCIQDLQANGGL